jgi:hypothetical protein
VVEEGVRSGEVVKEIVMKDKSVGLHCSLFFLAHHTLMNAVQKRKAYEVENVHYQLQSHQGTTELHDLQKDITMIYICRFNHFETLNWLPFSFSFLFLFLFLFSSFSFFQCRKEKS